MRSSLRALTVGALLMTGAVLQAAPAGAAAMRPPGPAESCSYSVSPDGKTGTGVCRNNGSRTVEFGLTFVCGWSPDLWSGYMTISPSESDGASATCGGTGVGSIVADFRDL
jgi:hypothetical protein